MGKLGNTAFETTGPVPTDAETGGVVPVDILHELGTSWGDRSVERTVTVSPSEWPTKVVVKSSVVGVGVRGLKSPEYLATIRRRQSAKIANSVRALEKHANSEDFAVWTHEPLDMLRQLVNTLSDAEEYSDPEHEGNTCEILRQLRDTFLDRGWERYRDTGVRAIAVQILQNLATADEVSGDDASQTMDLLLDRGLNPAVGTLLEYAEEEVPD